MTKKVTKILIGVMILAMGLAFCACGGDAPKTMEEYAANNPDFQESLKEYSNGDDSISIDIKENTMTFSYDVSDMGITEEMAMGDAVKSSLTEELDKQSSMFNNMAKEMEETTKIKGVNIVVKYLYGDKEICSKTFTAEE